MKYHFLYVFVTNITSGNSKVVMDIVVTLLIFLLAIMAFVVLGYVSYYRMRSGIENRHAGWYRNNDPRFWVNRWKRKCPRGCQLVGRDSGNADKKGGEFGCPDGEFCYGEQCCRYDTDCSKC